MGNEPSPESGKPNGWRLRNSNLWWDLKWLHEDSFLIFRLLTAPKGDRIATSSHSSQLELRAWLGIIVNLGTRCEHAPHRPDPSARVKSQWPVDTIERASILCSLRSNPEQSCTTILRSLAWSRNAPHRESRAFLTSLPDAAMP